jgi:hypothetical protein
MIWKKKNCFSIDTIPDFSHVDQVTDIERYRDRKKLWKHYKYCTYEYFFINMVLNHLLPSSKYTRAVAE